MKRIALLLVLAFCSTLVLRGGSVAYGAVQAFASPRPSPAAAPGPDPCMGVSITEFTLRNCAELERTQTQAQASESMLQTYRIACLKSRACALIRQQARN